MAPRFLTVHGYATFSTHNNTWSSHQAAITFGCKLNGAGDVKGVYVSQVWGQQSMNGETKKFIRPYFKDDEFQKMKEYALQRFQSMIDEPRQRSNRKARNDDDYTEDPSHKEDLCEYCQELGRNCTRRLKK